MQLHNDQEENQRISTGVLWNILKGQGLAGERYWEC